MSLATKSLVERAHQRDALLDLPALEPQRKGDPPAMEALIAGRRIDRKGDDLSGVVAATSSISMPPSVEHDEGHPAGGAIDQQREIKLALNVRTILDIDAVDLLAGGAGLARYQRPAEHPLGLGLCLLDRAGQAHAAAGPRIGLGKVALAAATSMDLCLDDPERALQFAGRHLGLFGAQNGTAVRHRGAVVAQQRLCLIFVDVHAGAPSVVMHRVWHSAARV
jgi:hypothetical protein